ncbi:lysophospholipid acyltransferase family protein [Candidatus Omnitrophota bacterium]
MDSKKIRKSIGRYFGWLVLKSCIFIVRILPGNQVYGFAKLIALLGYRIAAKQRKIALDSLAVAFGDEKSPAERERIARDCFIFMAKAGFEVVFMLDKFERIKQEISILGKEHLDSALSKGKGVILVSAHFGNFPLMLARLSLEGYRTGGIMRPMKDARVEKIFLEKREKLQIKTIYSIPRDTCIKEVIRALRANELIFVPLDQNFGTGGVLVEFFGRKAATATGPIVLARRAGAAVLPCFIIRQKDDTHKIVFEPPLDIEEGNSPKEIIRNSVQRITNIIEHYIRQYPAQWGWIHRRWKSAPK